MSSLIQNSLGGFVKKALLVFPLTLSFLNCSVFAEEPAHVEEITEFGVTWRFEKPVQSGQFANGHHWVLAPVTITSITPSFNGAQHGWEVNPSDLKKQGFDERAYYFDPARVPTLPYQAKTTQSIVKAVSITDEKKCRPCIRSVSVLTVLEEVPPENGANTFRPPYFGGSKPLISTDRLRMEILPSLDRVRSAPAMKEVIRRYSITHLDHQDTWVGRILHPSEGMPNYGSDIANYNAASALALMLSDKPDLRHEAVVRYVNNGIDLYYMMKNGVSWPPAGGHGEGRKLPIVFASVILDMPEMLTNPRMSERGVFGENGGVEFSEIAGLVLFAQQKLPEEAYWKNIGLHKGSKTVADPYHYIDGGLEPGGSYQFCCLSKNWQATVTALELMPELKPGFGNSDLISYVNRWETVGGWTQPDPCAPVIGKCRDGVNADGYCSSANAETACGIGECDYRANWAEYYGNKFGPDGNGSCILDTNSVDGIGRFPQFHGKNVGRGGHSDKFATKMWRKYVEPNISRESTPKDTDQKKQLPGAPVWKD